ncbi:hypothetical protein quinque_015857, partial [Culex quinquefasciatus]
RVVMLQSRILRSEPVEGPSEEGHDLYVVAGHEASY